MREENYERKRPDVEKEGELKEANSSIHNASDLDSVCLSMSRGKLPAKHPARKSKSRASGNAGEERSDSALDGRDGGQGEGRGTEQQRKAVWKQANSRCLHCPISTHVICLCNVFLRHVGLFFDIKINP